MDKKVVANEVLLEDAAALMNEGREVTLKPLGCSMLPFIRGGRDSVRLKKMPSVAVGDMLLVRLEGPRYVLHRLIAIDGDRLTLMGDGNLHQGRCPGHRRGHRTRQARGETRQRTVVAAPETVQKIYIRYL